MSKNAVSDTITHQEMAFAHLVLSETMNDRHAAKAAGLHPASAAHLKSKPRVRAYMLEYCAGVKEKLVDQEAEGPRKLNPDRDQVLTRLWELANFSPETTRGSITGQVKAISLIIAIEGLIPDRRASAAQTKPMAPPIKAEIYKAEWLRKQQAQSADEKPAETVAGAQTPPVASQVPEPPRPSDRNMQQNNPSPANSLTLPKELSWVPDTASRIPDPVLGPAGSLGQPFQLPNAPFWRRGR